MKDPEKIGEQNLEEGLVAWTPESYSQSLQAGPPVKARILKVLCPYCAIGTGNVVVEGPDVIGPGEGQQADIRPKQCDKCSRFFRIGYRIQYVGIRMEGE